MKRIFVIQPNPKPRNKRGPDDPNGYWHRCGVAFENRDGSINLKLDMFPDLQLQIREDSNNSVEAEREPGEEG